MNEFCAIQGSFFLFIKPLKMAKITFYRTSITRYLYGKYVPIYEDFVVLIEYFNISEVFMVLLTRKSL